MIFYLVITTFFSISLAQSSAVNGKCPTIKSGVAGICLEGCSSDAECGIGQRCCSNGCGHTCVGVFPKNTCATLDSCICPPNKTSYLQRYILMGVKCASCVCVDPCKDACPAGYDCQVTPVVCKKAPCPPIVQCVSQNPCNYGTPLNGYFCGRSSAHKDCPKNSTCIVDPADRFAVCCPNDPCNGTCDPLKNLKCDFTGKNYGCVTKCFFPPCAAPPVDPLTGQPRTCPYGNSHNSNGCFQCGCFDPCATVKCVAGKTCVVLKAPSCDKGYCPPYYAICL